MKKRLTAVVMTASLAVGLTACGGQEAGNTDVSGSVSTETSADTALESTEGDNKEPVTLSLYFWGNQTRNDLTQQAVDLYMSEHSDVIINVEFTDWSGYWDKLAATTSGGNMPDIVQMDYGYLNQYTSSNSLYDMTEFLNDGTIDTADIASSVIESGSVDGGFYAFSLGSNVPCFLYDMEIVKNAGVEIKEQMTLEEFYDVCETIYEKTGVKTYFDGGVNMATNICRADGKYIWDEVSAGEASSLTKFFAYVDKFQQAEFSISPEILVEKNPDVVESKPILDQTTWNDFAHSNQYISIASACGRELGISMYPTTGDAAVNPLFLKPSQFFSIASTSEHPKEAAEFINWFVNSVECNEILGGERGVPVNSKVRDALKETMAKSEETAVNVKIYEYIDSAAGVATPIDPPNPAGSTEAGTLLTTYVENVRYGKITPEDAGQKYIEEAKGIMEEAAKN
ncbi:ABC transporter substrate-binding protein [Acetatifactor muris]|uniref:ABC transporter substrate-binding protein YesO n=1 Tax=Acetatifactor muris TaxID=879566 RepID=A0A2K4ZE11_9FIRM|nr:ABC transporter substrate-binding protein [Acetatifactor muris]MCR2047100.1 ABC transporter substrate-binding protein [Acetatifactor muris]SOY28707.1 Putative ABC transporter substrate-binding protein YesO [Acetatifactor muris]